MPDVVLDVDFDKVRVEGHVLDCRTADLALDSPERRGPRGGTQRRALVHDFNDGLTVNYRGDYPGGVTIVDARVSLHVEQGQGAQPRLPKDANPGELRMVVTTQSVSGLELGSVTSLWLCVESNRSVSQALAATWRQVMLGPEVVGND